MVKINLDQSTPEILRDAWKSWDKKQKEKLLKARGLDKSWAETKTVDEMVARGGGIVAKDLHELVKEHKKRRVNF